jgi:hypothetical protein
MTGNAGCSASGARGWLRLRASEPGPNRTYMATVHFSPASNATSLSIVPDGEVLAARLLKKGADEVEVDWGGIVSTLLAVEDDLICLVDTYRVGPFSKRRGSHSRCASRGWPSPIHGAPRTRRRTGRSRTHSTSRPTLFTKPSNASVGSRVPSGVERVDQRRLYACGGEVMPPVSRHDHVFFGR